MQMQVRGKTTAMPVPFRPLRFAWTGNQKITLHGVRHFIDC
jgi:hypothetical protein